MADIRDTSDYPVHVLETFRKFFPGHFKYSNFLGKSLMAKKEDFMKPFEAFIGVHTSFKPNDADHNWRTPFNTLADLKVGTERVHYTNWLNSRL